MAASPDPDRYEIDKILAQWAPICADSGSLPFIMIMVKDTGSHRAFCVVSPREFTREEIRRIIKIVLDGDTVFVDDAS